MLIHAVPFKQLHVRETPLVYGAGIIIRTI
jgi:hypothetical protein